MCPHALCLGQQHEAGASTFTEKLFFNQNYMLEDDFDNSKEDMKIYGG